MIASYVGIVSEIEDMLANKRPIKTLLPCHKFLLSKKGFTLNKFSSRMILKDSSDVIKWFNISASAAEKYLKQIHFSHFTSAS